MAIMLDGEGEAQDRTYWRTCAALAAWVVLTAMLLIGCGPGFRTFTRDFDATVVEPARALGTRGCSAIVEDVMTHQRVSVSQPTEMCRTLTEVGMLTRVRGRITLHYVGSQQPTPEHCSPATDCEVWSYEWTLTIPMKGYQ